MIVDCLTLPIEARKRMLTHTEVEDPYVREYSEFL